MRRSTLRPEVAPSPREMDLLRVMYERGEATARQLYEAFGKEITLSALHGYLGRMVDKTLITRRFLGRTLWFKPVHSKDDLFGRLFRRLRSFLPLPPAQIVSQLAGHGKMSPRDLGELKELIRQLEQGKTHVRPARSAPSGIAVRAPGRRRSSREENPAETVPPPHPSGMASTL